jgi:hypothetical protein
MHSCCGAFGRNMAHRYQSRSYNVSVAIRGLADIGWRRSGEASVRLTRSCARILCEIDDI